MKRGVHRWRAALAAAWLGGAALAAADDGPPMPAPDLPAYTLECASCHLAYPPGLLPAASWGRLMSSLDRHFGSNASLDEATRRQIADWLQAHAGTGRRAGEAPPQDRITRSAWFERKHRKVEAATWALPAVKSPAHCEACHGGAARGEFDDDALTQPPGLSAAQRRRWGD